jgi:hypothetical protein
VEVDVDVVVVELKEPDRGQRTPESWRVREGCATKREEPRLHCKHAQLAASHPSTGRRHAKSLGVPVLPPAWERQSCRP